MTSTEEWDVEKHKVEHECDEHWELRRNFLEAHKDKFPEEQLVCLAQVFTNVELLGCRYPKETMDLIAELSEDVAKDYREKQKTKLQRTFVKASDAASSKAKGGKPASGNIGHTNCGEKKGKISFISSEDTTTSCKRMKIDNAPFGRIILMQHLDEHPTAVLQNCANSNRAKLEFNAEKRDDKYYCEIFLNSIKLAEGLGENSKKAKAAASVVGLSVLQKYYYTVKVKRLERKDGCDMNQLMGSSDAPQDVIASDNVGSKMMRMMGWSGGGLGKKQQGRVEPVTVERQLSREGFGLKLNAKNATVFTQKVRETLKSYVRGQAKSDLVFAPDFTNEERAVIHKKSYRKRRSNIGAPEIVISPESLCFSNLKSHFSVYRVKNRVARELGLKAASSGPKDKRTLVVSRKSSPADIVEELLACGGSNEKYDLVEPTGT